MAVLLTSSDIASVLNEIRSKRLTLEDGRNRLVKMIAPLISSVCNKHPMYMRDDMAQDLSIRFLGEVENLVKDFHYGTIRDLLDYVFHILRKDAIDIFRKRRREDYKFVRLEDANIEMAFFPKTYEKSKLIAKIRKALEDFYNSRYNKKGYADRASKFAYLMLDGKRPSMKFNNLRGFFHGNHELALQAYTTSLVIIRQIIGQHNSDTESIYEKDQIRRLKRDNDRIRAVKRIREDESNKF